MAKFKRSSSYVQDDRKRDIIEQTIREDARQSYNSRSVNRTNKENAQLSRKDMLKKLMVNKSWHEYVPDDMSGGRPDWNNPLLQYCRDGKCK